MIALDDHAEKLPRLRAAVIATVVFIVLTPLVYAALLSILFLLFFWPFVPSVDAPTRPVLTILCVLAASVSFMFTRRLYGWLRWQKRPGDEESIGVPTAGEWTWAIVSLAIIVPILSLVIPTLVRVYGLPAPAAVQWAAIAAVSAASSFLFLRGTVRRRVAEERELRIAKGLICRCGYDLTGNVSGVCPECGHEISRRS